MAYHGLGGLRGVLRGFSAVLLCLGIANCGGGGGGDGGGGQPASGTQAFVVSGGAACPAGRQACSDDSFVFNYGGGGGGGSSGGSGAGAGGGQSAMRNVTVTAYQPDGTQLGHADLLDNLVSLYPGAYTGPFILRFADNGSGRGEYFDESTKTWIALNGQGLHVMVPSLSHHISANPLTEAAYQYALKRYGSESALNATNMASANSAVRTQINLKLPLAYQSDDITNYTTTIDDTSGVGTLDNNKAGRYGAVLAGMPIGATQFNSSLTAPAIAFANQMAADIVDDGVLNDSASITPGSVAYTFASLAPNLHTGVCTAVATWGSAILPGASLGGAVATGSIPGYLTLLAGSVGGPGNCDGWGTNARFNWPSGLATDSAGNLYVVDTGNHTIRKITPAGAVSTFAGTAGLTGSVDGTGAAARFFQASDLATDSVGNLYVADTGNHTIRKITPAGVVSTFAGTAGLTGSADGIGASARFQGPYGLATDGAGNIYVADISNNTIRKITPAGVVSTLAGTAGLTGSADGTGAAARFNGPSGLAMDNAGNLYVADSRNRTIRKITPAGVVSTLAGTAGVDGHADGTGAAASFARPGGVATDSVGNLYVTDDMNHLIRKITPAGVVTTFAGTYGVYGSADGTGAAASFVYPQGVATDTAGNIYVSDSDNHTIRKITPAAVVSTFAGTARVMGSADGTGAAARFQIPFGLTTDFSGNIYVADTYNDTVRKITPAGVVTTFAGTAGIVGGGSVDGTGAAARFNEPMGLARDSAGNIYVADFGGSTIRKITPAGVVSTLAGTAGVPGSADGIGAAARFHYPNGVATSSTGNIYVADSFNQTIRKITPAGEVSTLAGTAGAPGSTDGTGAAARFNGPGGIATDGAGNVYVADAGNNTIRKITPAGVVSTFAGTAGATGSADGNGAAARFYAPGGLATDSVGNIYVADNGNHTIRKITPTGVVSTVVGSVGSIGNVPGPLPASLGSTVAFVTVVSDKVLAITSDSGVFLATFP